MTPAHWSYALDILTSHLENAGFDVDVLDLGVPGSDWGSLNISPTTIRSWWE